MSKDQELLDMGNTPYGISSLRDELAKLSRVERGNGVFNGTLNATACKLGSLVGGKELTEETVLNNLMKVCWDNGYAEDHPPGYVQGVIKSGMEAGRKNPRGPTDTTPDNVVPLPSAKVNMRRASDITPEKVGWLWPGVLARGAISMLAGNPGLGKSQASLSIAATVTTGGTWPASMDKADVGNVIVLSMEDSAEHTIVPRLKACGADLSKVSILTTVADERGERQFNLETDIRLLRESIRELGSVGLIIIDPITAYMGKSDANSSSDVRRITTELSALAQAHNCCVLMISHLNKKADQQASHRVLGSVSWIGAARTSLLIERDGDDSERRVMAPAKNNLAPDTTSFAFTLRSVELPGDIKTSYAAWENASHNNTADGVLIERGDGGAALTEARDVLAELLKHGRVRSTHANKARDENQISPSTWKRAKERLGIAAYVDDDGVTWWTDYKQRNQIAA